jgi:hypothetical protein
MYQPYPAASDPGDPARPAQPVPPTVTNAVRLMYAGAAVNLIAAVLAIALVGQFRAAVLKARPGETAAQLHTLDVGYVIGYGVLGLAFVALWLWMARMNRAGKKWARIVALVLFLLYSLYFLASVARTFTIGSVVLPLVVWLIGAGATFYLWRPPSSEYFETMSAR